MIKTVVKVTCNTGKTWMTEINGNLADATAYFMGKTIVDEDDATGQETAHTIVEVKESATA